MPVVRAQEPEGGLQIRVVDSAGQSVTGVDDFLSLLTGRSYSPHTVRAYAHDLAKLYDFLDEQGMQTETFRHGTARAILRWLRSRLDWDYLRGTHQQKPWLVADRLGLGLGRQLDEFAARNLQLRRGTHRRHDWFSSRLVLHSGDVHLQHITDPPVDKFYQAMFYRHDDPELTPVVRAPIVWRGERNWLVWPRSSSTTQGIISTAPQRILEGPLPNKLSIQPRINALTALYLQERAVIDRPSTVDHIKGGLRRLGDWLAENRPQMTIPTDLRRADTVEFIDWVQRLPRADGARTVSPAHQRSVIWNGLASLDQSGHPREEA